MILIIREVSPQKVVPRTTAPSYSAGVYIHNTPLAKAKLWISRAFFVPVKAGKDTTIWLILANNENNNFKQFFSDLIFLGTFNPLKSHSFWGRSGKEQYVFQTILLILSNNQLPPRCNLVSNSKMPAFYSSWTRTIGQKLWLEHWAKFFSLFSLRRFHNLEHYSKTFNYLFFFPFSKKFSEYFSSKLQN